jgi:hypothetical protein
LKNLKGRAGKFQQQALRQMFEKHKIHMGVGRRNKGLETENSLQLVL